MDQHEITSGLLGAIPGLLFIAIVIIAVLVRITEWFVRGKDVVDRAKDREFHIDE